MRNSLKKDYEAIWNKYHTTEINASTKSDEMKLLDRGFVFQFDEDEIECDILFVGINPSFSKGSSKEYRIYGKNDADHPYFKPFRKVEEDLKEDYNKQITWSHIDLLVFRETNQNHIKDKMFKTKAGVDFIVDLLNISKKKLEYLRPKVIVVANTMAKELLGKNRGLKNDKEFGVWMGYKFEFNKNLGVDIITTPGPLQDTKVFFTSMLSGQRALDNGSRQRLAWHISKVLDHVD